MYQKIKQLADEAIALQNKDRMDAVLREISTLCDASEECIYQASMTHEQHAAHEAATAKMWSEGRDEKALAAQPADFGTGIGNDPAVILAQERETAAMREKIDGVTGAQRSKTHADKYIEETSLYELCGRVQFDEPGVKYHSPGFGPLTKALMDDEEYAAIGEANINALCTDASELQQRNDDAFAQTEIGIELMASALPVVKIKKGGAK